MAVSARGHLSEALHVTVTTSEETEGRRQMEPKEMSKLTAGEGCVESGQPMLPAGDANFQKIDQIFGDSVDHTMLSTVLREDLEPGQLTRMDNLLWNVAPQLMNMLARGQSWDQIISGVSVKCDADAKAPGRTSTSGPGAELDDLFDDDDNTSAAGDEMSADTLQEHLLTPKILLTFMTARLPLSHRLRLAFWGKSIYPLPLVMRHSAENGRLVFESLHMQMILKGTFMASVPFHTQGNSTMLKRLFRRSFQLSPSHISPLHAGSVDISITTQTHVADYPIEPFHVMDFHTGSGKDALHSDERAAVQSALCAAQYFLIHFPFRNKRKEGWSETKKIVQEEVIPILDSVFHCGEVAEKKKKFFLLGRDADDKDKHLETKQSLLLQDFQEWEKKWEVEPGDIKFDTTPDFSEMPTIKQNQHLGRIYDGVRKHFSGACQYKDYWLFTSAVTTCMTSHVCPRLAPPNSTAADAEKTQQNHEHILNTIDEVGGDFSETLKWSTSPFVKESADVQAQKSKETLPDIVNRRAHMKPSNLVSKFLESVSEEAANLAEWKWQLTVLADSYEIELKTLQKTVLGVAG